MCVGNMSELGAEIEDKQFSLQKLMGSRKSRFTYDLKREMV